MKLLGDLSGESFGIGKVDGGSCYVGSLLRQFYKRVLIQECTILIWLGIK